MSEYSTTYVNEACETMGNLFFNNPTSFSAYHLGGIPNSSYYRIFPYIKDNDIATVEINRSFPFVIVFNKLFIGTQILNDFFIKKDTCFLKKGWGMALDLSIKQNKIPILLISERTSVPIEANPSLLAIDPTVLPENLYNYLSIPSNYLSMVITTIEGRKSIVSLFTLDDFSAINKEIIHTRMSHMFKKEYERIYRRHHAAV